MTCPTAAPTDPSRDPCGSSSSGVPIGYFTKYCPIRMNISFSVLSPPTIWHASQMPSRALGPVSQTLSVLQLAGGRIFPVTHCFGVEFETDRAWDGTVRH